MTIQRGVSLYSYQQSQFFKELMLDEQIREVGSGLEGADGIEIVDEMSLRYPDPGEAFVRHWFEHMERCGTKPITMDVGMDVLQFRDHVMTHEECAERLRHDIRLARRLGFRYVRVLSVCPLDVMVAVLPLIEKLDMRIGKEIHQPMKLDGRQVTEIVEYVERTGNRRIGIVPDFGIFQTQPSEAQLGWFERKGANPLACQASVDLSQLINEGNSPFDVRGLALNTAGNIRSGFGRYLATGAVDPVLETAFVGVKAFADGRVPDASRLDYTVVAEALNLSRTSTDLLRELVPHVVSCHAKFNHMSVVPGTGDQYQDVAIDYPGAIRALKAGGYSGYLNSEYEGQRYWQDRTRADMQSEVEQVRRHHSMMRRLIAA